MYVHDLTSDQHEPCQYLFFTYLINYYLLVHQPYFHPIVRSFHSLFMALLTHCKHKIGTRYLKIDNLKKNRDHKKVPKQDEDT